ncbi:L,D-transpeptidase family protein [Mycobacterium sp. AZCC_0083]|uniref:L,D-transpeptidase n=1 Tax=Mycobacterium sp. AZCC_0083 TaxID=2735882 RepID=UPI0016188C51|nr:L,D-transpeptidase [Mycobacterium sp. AZCC_0083]MBB5163372.1 lipoprotein-anchoring transpeptidase ErfK/SrfK [Mycobacterium sp. AZCC_0083]
MPQGKMKRLVTAIFAAGLVGGLAVNSPSAWADPEVNPDPAAIDAAPVEQPVPPPPPPPLELPPMPWDAPPPVDPLAAPAPAPQPTVIPEGTPAGQDPTAYTGAPVFAPPTFNPTNGSKVGAAKPIYINFARPIADRALAQAAVHISSVPPVPGRFYWTNDTQLRWRPQDFWPAGTVVNIDAGGTKSSFTVPEQLVATIDDATHQMTVSRNGKVEKTIPVSMGMSGGGHATPNGTYYVLEKFPTIVMDSSTYGVPVDSANGYKLNVQLAVRIDNSGNFVHSAPWSVADQGKRNVSHGCINISPDNAKWFYDNFGSGDAIVVKNSKGTYTQPDGASDWQMF